MTKTINRLIHFLFAKEIKLIEVLIFATLLSAIYLNNLVLVEFHGDETFWIVSGERLDKFITLDFKSPYWTEDLYLAYEVRPVSSYLVGIGQWVGGIAKSELHDYWDWQLSAEENAARGALPSERIILWSRIPLALVSVFGILGILILLASSHSRLAAYLFALVGLNGYFLIHLRRALSEPPLILFTVLALYSSYKLLVAAQGRSGKSMVVWSVIVGVFSGLAGESKLTGIACAGIAVLGTMILMSDREKALQLSQRRIPLIIALVVGGATLLSFIASYPFFFEDTATRIKDTLYTRQEITQYQVIQYADRAIQPGDRLGVLFQRIFNYPINLNVNNIIARLAPWANFVLTLLGIVYSVKQVWMKNKGWEYFAVFLLGAFLCAVPMLFTPLDWERYYMYPIFFSCIFFCIGAGELVFTSISNLQKQQDAKGNRLELLQD